MARLLQYKYRALTDCATGAWEVLSQGLKKRLESDITKAKKNAWKVISEGLKNRLESDIRRAKKTLGK